MMIGSRDGLGILMPIQLNHAAAEMTATGGSGGSPPARAAKEERLPLWSKHVMRDFIGIRGELERDFNVSKRNKDAVGGGGGEVDGERVPEEPRSVQVQVEESRHSVQAVGFAMAEATPDAAKLQRESETTQFFMPYRGFCSRKGIQLIEVVLEDADVPKALNEYITTQHIHNFVLGATSRNALAKKFRNPDVASTMVKTAPDFCAVYVISNGKAVTVRSAKGLVPAKPADATDPDGSVRF